jgi:hypothetical protein
MVSKGTAQMMSSMPYNPNMWSQGIKNEIAQYGTTIEHEITGIDWGKEVLKRYKFGQSQTAELARRYMMTEDDMSFMEPIYLERQLPFPEYLTHCGYHAMTQEVLNRVEAEGIAEGAHSEDGTKRSALEGMMNKYGLHFRAVYSFPCKGGASISVSVISGKMFYSRTDAPYEIMGVALEDGQSGDEPMPYQTDEQLMIYLAKVLAHSQEY